MRLFGKVAIMWTTTTHQARQLRLFVCALVALMLLPSAAQSDAISNYDFQSLNPGVLGGQDNWVHDDTAMAMVVAQDSLPGNGTKAMGNSFYDGMGVHYSYRANNGAFSFPTLSSSNSSLYFQFDARVLSTSDNQALFDLCGYYDATHFNYSPQFGMSGQYFYIRRANHGTVDTVAIPSRIAANDWVRIRLAMDFTANSGNGVGNLSYLDLTKADPIFFPLISSEPLDIKSTSYYNPATWNRMEIRTGFAVNQFVDNLTVAVPEPAAICLLGIGTFVVLVALTVGSSIRSR
jgi:hypothetical protein